MVVVTCKTCIKPLSLLLQLASVVTILYSFSATTWRLYYKLKQGQLSQPVSRHYGFNGVNTHTNKLHSMRSPVKLDQKLYL